MNNINNKTSQLSQMIRRWVGRVKSMLPKGTRKKFCDLEVDRSVDWMRDHLSRSRCEKHRVVRYVRMGSQEAVDGLLWRVVGHGDGCERE
jgi:hypothetical protein